MNKLTALKLAMRQPDVLNKAVDLIEEIQSVDGGGFSPQVRGRLLKSYWALVRTVRASD